MGTIGAKTTAKTRKQEEEAPMEQRKGKRRKYILLTQKRISKKLRVTRKQSRMTDYTSVRECPPNYEDNDMRLLRALHETQYSYESDYGYK